MSGLEKIRDRILEEASEKADEKMKEAEDKASEIKSEAVREADKIAGDAKAKAENEVRIYKERVDSSIDLDRRTRLLSAKQEIIGDVIGEAKKRILELNDKDYFELILKLIEKNMKPGEGIIYFSEQDLKRVPSGFTFDVARIAKQHGGELSVSKDKRDIGPGFVLGYGGIEENCTFDALFEEKKDELTDIVKTILFS